MGRAKGIFKHSRFASVRMGEAYVSIASEMVLIFCMHCIGSNQRRDDQGDEETGTHPSRKLIERPIIYYNYSQSNNFDDLLLEN